ncbi:hypothetical protein AN964_13425 [Heyndrickxia shackletonii]|uniref:Spore germination protein (Amino acid permease) n=1 Tax=Heyndrickxia shackletonii TaxID=157838 RepID=A0A0Q3WXQ6_9BACI|nr:GerAB/ArcD/ProY family transporter [Heyndrickxia shackletonii]KQL54399.1 hypothetical protein AN964_13425 [Heyndrickxia shackletonii]NEY99115.1 GerAB/ArcD/ProY family transporter [Heyndrickxia shackletonii]
MQAQTFSDAQKFSPYYIFFLIVMAQVGIGYLDFQKFITKFAGYDGWQAVIIAGLTTNIVMWFMLKQLQMVKGDFCDIHWTIFGKKFGNLLNILFAIYYLWYAITVLRNYIAIVQVWMFPDLSTFWFAAGYILLCIYIVFGGIRTIIGIAFFAFVLPFYIIFIQGFTIQFSDFRHFFPVFDHSFHDVMKASESMSLSNMGYETILMFYPFIKNPSKANKWGQLSLIFTTVLFIYTSFLSFAFYSKDQLAKEVWPTLTAFKIVKLPVVERFEFIGIANWCIVILPSICISLWCASRLLKRTTKLKMKYGTLILSFLILMGCIFFDEKDKIYILNSIINSIGFIIGYIYIPILFVILSIVMKIKSNKKT